MNKFFLSSIALATFTLSILLFQLINNSKANSSALANPIPFTKEQILISKVWKVDKLYYVIAGQYSYYERAVSTILELITIKCGLHLTKIEVVHILIMKEHFLISTGNLIQKINVA